MNCPTCDSPDPKKHPAMQFEGEVQPCNNPWHIPSATIPESPDPTTKDVGLEILDEDNSLVRYAQRELYNAGVQNDIYGDALPNAVIELLRVFTKQGHSGMSGSIVLQLFTKLANMEPITPLTGDDLEWNHLTEDADPERVQGIKLYQNNRCSRVFKRVYPDGTVEAYDIDGRIYEEPDGSRWSGKGSRVYVEFPYMPTTEIVKVNSVREV